MSKEKENSTLAELTAKAAATVQSESGQSTAAIGAEGQRIIASSSGKAYQVRPLGIGKVSQVTERIQKLEKLMQEGIKEGKTEQQLIMEVNSPVLDIMAEIIQLGLVRQHPDITIEIVKDEFSLGDFPKVYQLVLDLNDFLAGMRSLLTQV